MAGSAAKVFVINSVICKVAHDMSTPSHPDPDPKDPAVERTTTLQTRSSLSDEIPNYEILIMLSEVNKRVLAQDDGSECSAKSPIAENWQKHTTGGIPRWSPTLVLVARFSAYVWQSGRDAQFSLTYGRMCLILVLRVIYRFNPNLLSSTRPECGVARSLRYACEFPSSAHPPCI
jgi:hypothetical protein